MFEAHFHRPDDITAVAQDQEKQGPKKSDCGETASLRKSAPKIAAFPGMTWALT